MGEFEKQGLIKKIQQKSGIDSLDGREKGVLLGGIIFVLCFFVLQLVILPLLDVRTNLETSIEKKSRELEKIKQLKGEYQQLKVQEGGIQAMIADRSPGFTLFTFLDKQVTEAQVKKQIKYMKPSTEEGDDNLNESMVEMKLQRITLNALVSFIMLVESEENVVSIRRISVQESGNEQGYLDVILQIITFELKG
ncbi:MAG: type II secretion system protein M [Deltaproteobacteria bacterium]|nr:type II secretion system protein M [Deltaproteobacteria bacterium]